MSKNFWQTLKKPILALAPMADVTDAAFRALIARYGKPDVMFTEFTSADGLASEGRKKLLLNFQYSEIERPIVAQIFGAQPENIRTASALAKKLGFDGIDINMGCPDRSIIKQGAGGATIKTPKLAREIIAAAKEGARGLPVSVKTRLGFSSDVLETWLPELLKAEPDAITIHARTVKELSLVPARWERVRRAVEIRDAMGSETLILGNGDVWNIADAKKKIKESGADGVMLGRAIFGNPWLFSGTSVPEDLGERFQVLLEHVALFDEYFKRKKNFAIMKKHFKAYVHGFEGAKELRVQLMEVEKASEIRPIIKGFLNSWKQGKETLD